MNILIQLPTELWAYISSFLSNNDLDNLRLTSKEYNVLASSDLLWKKTRDAITAYLPQFPISNVRKELKNLIINLKKKIKKIPLGNISPELLKIFFKKTAPSNEEIKTLILIEGLSKIPHI